MTGEPVQETVEISVVSPVYNEEGNVAALTAEIETTLETLGRSFEIILVDDGSTDGSLAAMRGLTADRPWLKILVHRRNFGQSAGLATGFRRARGRIVITLDSDLQNDPADIPLLLAGLEDGTDAVCGIRRRRMDNFVRKMSSKIANGFRNAVTGDRITDSGCSFRAIRREALREVLVFNGMHRFLPTILRWQGFQVKEIEVGHRPRTSGVTKYGVHNRLWRGILDCLAMRWYKRRRLQTRRTGSETNGSDA